MTSTHTQREPGGDVLDRYLPAKDQTTTLPETAAEPEQTAEPAPAAAEPTAGEARGEDRPAQAAAVHKSVQQRRAEADTAERLLAIQERDRSHEVDTDKVRKARKAATEAGKLRAWRAHPDAVALRDARMRTGITVAALFAAVCALGWSTASVQITAANGAAHGSVGWWLAFLVEPLISIGLLATIAVEAYAAMRGLTVDPASEHGQTLRSTQRWLLGLTVTLNTWPYVTPVWSPEPFSLIQVVVHLVGPIVAVRMIHSLPAMWAVLESLPLPDHRATEIPAPGPTDAGHHASSPTVHTRPVAPDRPLPTRASRPAPPRPNAPSLEQLQSQLRAAVADGADVDPTSASSIRDFFGIGMDRARKLRDTYPLAATAA